MWEERQDLKQRRRVKCKNNNLKSQKKRQKMLERLQLLQSITKIMRNQPRRKLIIKYNLMQMSIMSIQVLG